MDKKTTIFVHTSEHQVVEAKVMISLQTLPCFYQP